jgi:hypothetical protein
VSGRPRRGVWRGSCWRDGGKTAKQSQTARVRGRATRSDARASTARARRVARGRWFSKCSGQVGAMTPGPAVY